MNINFPPVDERFIKEKISAGYYSNATELVRDAVRRLREASNPQSSLWASVQKGEEDIAAGRYRLYTPELLEEMIQNAEKKEARGEEPDPDVMP